MLNHYTVSDKRTNYEEARNALVEQYGLTDRASDLRDSCCAAVAAVELPWADFVGPHVPASLQNNMEATSTTRYVRGVRDRPQEHL